MIAQEKKDRTQEVGSDEERSQIGDQCPACLNDIEYQDEIAQFKCGHMLCRSCLQKYYDTQPACSA